MHLTPGLAHNFVNVVGVLSPVHKTILDSYLKSIGGVPGNSGLSSQQ